MIEGKRDIKRMKGRGSSKGERRTLKAGKRDEENVGKRE